MLIGVTGGIGAGKSTVLAVLGELGEAVLDADLLVHELYATDDGLRDGLVQRWGGRVLTGGGRVDRQAVASCVFGNRDELAWLNRQVHPLVKNLMVAKAQKFGKRCFCAVPLLFEVGWDQDMARTVAVWCDGQIQQQRLRERGWDDTHIAARCGAQLSMDEKLERADYALVNNGTLALLKDQCCRLLIQLNNDMIV